MRVVRDEEGSYYVLQDSDGETCRIREVTTATLTTRPCAELSPITAADVLGADGLAGAIGSIRALALLIELDVSGPTSARGLLDRFDVCESDLHGVTAQLRTAGLIEQTTVHGERGYRVTERASDALELP
ncbi:MAG: hypothetical protein V5A21_02045 [Halapricum sp.]